MTHAKRKFISRLIIVGLFVLLVPWRSQIAPAWKIRAVDQSGDPIPGLAVSQNWIDPNFQGRWLEEDFKTDEKGFVSFPERSTWQNVFLKVGSPIWNRVLFGKKSYDAIAFGWGSYTRGEVYYRSGQVIPDRLVMYREPPVPSAANKALQLTAR